VALFFGGWTTGIAPLENALMATPAVFENGVMTTAPSFYWFGTAIHLLAFCAKVFGLVFIMMWIRWTLPRFRVDQMMTLCWKKLIPIGLFCVVAVSVWLLARMWLFRTYGENNVETIIFWSRFVFAFAIIGGIVWFFAKPLSAEQKSQRELLSKAKLNPGTAV
jgi:hypothetical protein